MKITVIGAGNMGGAILRGILRSGRIAPSDLTVADPNPQILADFRNEGCHTTASAAEAVREADLVVLAVKPWLVDEQAAATAPAMRPDACLASIAAGVTFSQLRNHYSSSHPLFRVMPNTAASIGQSMTFIAADSASDDQRQAVVSLFEPLGPVQQIAEAQMGACMALASCGIAYALRYIRAAVEGGVELGMSAAAAQQIVAQTVKGAAELLLTNSEAHAEAEIDKVTTPGGITIKGLNEMEAQGFTHAVISGLKASK